MNPIFAEIGAALDKAALEAGRARAAAQRLARGPEDELGRWIHVSAVASGVERAYSGMERTFRIVAAEIDGAVPTGEDWHARLCALMFTPVPGRRPAVLPGALRAELDELRAFRHRVRNLYGDELIASVVRRRAARTHAVVAKVRRALKAFEKAVTGAPDRERFVNQIARAARERGSREALAVAEEALASGNEALDLAKPKAAPQPKAAYRARRKRRPAR